MAELRWKLSFYLFCLWVKVTPNGHAKNAMLEGIVKGGKAYFERSPRNA